jgi:hypothetical protein
MLPSYKKPGRQHTSAILDHGVQAAFGMRQRRGHASGIDSLTVRRFNAADVRGKDADVEP